VKSDEEMETLDSWNPTTTSKKTSEVMVSQGRRGVEDRFYRPLGLPVLVKDRR